MLRNFLCRPSIRLYRVCSSGGGGWNGRCGRRTGAAHRYRDRLGAARPGALVPAVRTQPDVSPLCRADLGPDRERREFVTGTASRSDGDVERQTVARFSDVWNLAGVALLRFGLATEALD